MTKKFIIKEAWLLDENGNKSLKLKQQLDPNEVFEVRVDHESVRGGPGKVSNEAERIED
ncbi:hypothetical protein [Paenibacillus sp. XY044]|uniref:hypothetical protein n=1 Tax=Paenibacillus sp. XY044 TaxID=2026089 RepID=UPI0015C61186|nr:hypothetical protein [Paenibacillus sp. XY044]